MEVSCSDCGPLMKRTMLTGLTPQPGVAAQPSWRSSGRAKKLSDMDSAGCLVACSPLVSVYTPTEYASCSVCREPLM